MVFLVYFFMVPLRNALIVKEHATLLYPENLRYEKGEVEGRVRAKMKLIEKIKKHSNISLNTTTPKFRKKFNLFFIALK